MERFVTAMMRASTAGLGRPPRRPVRCSMPCRALRIRTCRASPSRTRKNSFRCCRSFCSPGNGRRRMFEARVAELEALARDQGLDFFPVSFEVVPQDIMTEVAAYGLPTRARHWSYGKVYQHQHLYGT